MKQNAIKEKVHHTLHTIQDMFSNKGIISTYLRGSLSTGEFDPGTSDVDTIGICDIYDQKLKEEINEYIKKIAPEIHDFKMNLLSMPELKTGIADPNNRLTHVIPPRVLLLDLLQREHITGEKIYPEKVTEYPPTPKEAIILGLQKIERDRWFHSVNVEPELRVYHLKGLLRIIHFQQREAGVKDTYSLKSITTHATQQQERIIDIFKKLKKHNFNNVIYTQYTETLDEFMREIAQQYGYEIS